MNTMRAVVVSPTAPGRLALGDVDAPSPLPSEAVVRVAAVSLNRGEVRRSTTAVAGWRPGWDLAGTVEIAAADGSGPIVGTRVVGFVLSGAWAELVAVPTHNLAELPGAVSFSQASTLPVAGLTALHTLAKGGSLLGRSVLITGASGGVGYFACQIAGYSGAQVTAHVRRNDLVDFVKQAGAHQVIVGEDFAPTSQNDSYDLILDSVGGATLSAALTTLARNGICVLFGTSAGHEVTFDARKFYGTGGASLYGFILFHELEREPASVGLRRLVKLLSEGHLHPHIDLEASWTQVASVAQNLTERRFVGKAVLHISD